MKPSAKLGFLAAACALLIITFSIIGPRTVRAAVATLVQVVNTSANPIPIQDVSKASSQLVWIWCRQVSPGNVGTDCVQESVFGQNQAFTAVPAGQNLVITEIDYTPTQPGPGTDDVVLAVNNQLVTQRIITNTVTTQVTFPGSGIVVGAGNGIGLEVLGANFGLSPSAGPVSMDVHGYFTAN